jgi:hypothetical protein
VDGDWPCERLDDAVRDAERVAVAVEALAQDSELIAAEPGHGVMGSDCRSDPQRRLSQSGIAGGMAEAVVDALEAVDVDEQDSNASLSVPPALEGVLEAVVEERPVRQPGQVVVQGHVRELNLRALTLNRVADRTLQRGGIQPFACQDVLRARLHSRQRTRRVSIGADDDGRDVCPGRLEVSQRTHRLEPRSRGVEHYARHTRAGEETHRVGDGLVVHAPDAQALGRQIGQLSCLAGATDDKQPRTHARLADTVRRAVVVT